MKDKEEHTRKYNIKLKNAQASLHCIAHMPKRRGKKYMVLQQHQTQVK